MSSHDPINIILYESSSRGGCYKYVIELFKAYQQTEGVGSVALLLPSNAGYSGSAVHKILVSDNKQGNKAYFLWRQLINPLLLLRFILKQKKAGSKNLFVLLNDFEQLTAPIWSPLYRLLIRNVILGVFLHDADRDAYPPSPGISARCMKKMMSIMDIGLHHGNLPKRSYYQNTKTIFQKVEHGLYEAAGTDKELQEQITLWKQQFKEPILIIPGHIRAEKNYLLVFESLKKNKDKGLIIAGSSANSSISVSELKTAAANCGLADQVLWIDKYLSEEEMTTALKCSDIVLLYYASSFHAQSGILNQVAPLQIPVITGRLDNALSQSVEQYNLGWIIPPDSVQALSELLTGINKEQIKPRWEDYYTNSAWSKQTALVLALLNKILAK